jgi:modulator of FtsH protease
VKRPTPHRPPRQTTPFETSQIIHGGETNYILATVSLYVSIFNLFTSLLHLLGVFSRDD